MLAAPAPLTPGRVVVRSIGQVMLGVMTFLGVVVAIVPLSILGQHLAVTDWRSAFV